MSNVSQAKEWLLCLKRQFHIFEKFSFQFFTVLPIAIWREMWYNIQADEKDGTNAETDTRSVDSENAGVAQWQSSWFVISRLMVRLRSPAPYGGIPEWPKGADCKSVAFQLRWSESTFPHQKSTNLDRGLSIFTYYLFTLHFSLILWVDFWK